MNEKYQLYYYWNHGMCDQCGAPILILNEALSYEGNDQQELQAFLDEHAVPNRANFQSGTEKF